MRPLGRTALALAAAALLPLLAAAQSQTSTGSSSAPAITQSGLLDRIASARSLLATGVSQGTIGSAMAQGWTTSLNKVQADAGKSGLTDAQLRVLSHRLDRLVKRLQAAAKPS